MPSSSLGVGWAAAAGWVQVRGAATAAVGVEAMGRVVVREVATVVMEAAALVGAMVVGMGVGVTGGVAPGADSPAGPMAAEAAEGAEAVTA